MNQLIKDLKIIEKYIELAKRGDKRAIRRGFQRIDQLKADLHEALKAEYLHKLIYAINSGKILNKFYCDYRIRYRPPNTVRGYRYDSWIESNFWGI